MARRRKSGSDGGGINLDSLMDALTNVVAVLILVLILVQADVTQKVTEFLDSLEPATPEEVIESRLAVEQLQERLKDKEDLMEKEPPTPEEIEEEKRQLALLEKDAKENTELLADLVELRKLEAKLRKERDTEQIETTKVQNEIARLEALLDETPILEIPPQEVTIPNSRPIPPNAEIYYALVFSDRVHLIDPFTPLELFMDEFKDHKRDWEVERIKRQGRDRYIYDQEKIVAHFTDFDFKNSRAQSVRVMPNPTGTRLQIQVAPDAKTGGTSLAELDVPGSRFQKMMDTLQGNRRAVIMFYVHPNSFNTYLRARTIADKAGVPAGWEVRGNTSYWIYLGDVEVRRLREPPPPKPDNKPKPPALKPKLD